LEHVFGPSNWLLGFAIMIFETIQMALKVAAAPADDDDDDDGDVNVDGHMTCAKKEELEQTRKPAASKIFEKRLERE